MQGEQPPTSADAGLPISLATRSATPGQSAAPPRLLPASDADARPMTLDYGKPPQSVMLARAIRTHFVVAVCGCCLAVLHGLSLANLFISRSISLYYFHHGGDGARHWEDWVCLVLSMPMSVLHCVRLGPTDSMIGLCANSLLWGIGIAYGVYWGLRRLQRRAC